MKINIDTTGPVQLTLDTGETLDLMVTEELSSLVRAIAEYAGSHRPMTPTEKTLDYVARTADDETLLDMQEIFPSWGIGKGYTKDSVVNFNGDLWRILQAHTSQADWLPPDVPALYVRIAPPGVIPEWRQPQGAHDAYAKDDKVTHQSKTWQSDVADNVWEPGVYGWKEVTE